MPKSTSRKKKSPKRVLALPDLEHAKTAVKGLRQPERPTSGQRTYARDHQSAAGSCPLVSRTRRLIPVC